MHFMNDFRPIASSGDPTQPGIRKFGGPRSRNGFDSMGVDNIRSEMDGQNGEGGGGDDASRVVAFEAEGRGRHYEGSCSAGHHLHDTTYALVKSQGASSRSSKYLRSRL